MIINSPQPGCCGNTTQIIFIGGLYMEKDIKNTPAPTDRALDAISLKDLKTDPFGSYTGRPADEKERPVQDADDL